MKRAILHFLSWLAILASFVAMMVAILFTDTINHPYQVQAAIIVGGIVMLAGGIGAIVTRHPDKFYYF